MHSQMLQSERWSSIQLIPVAAYYTVQHPDQFELAAGRSGLEPALEGLEYHVVLASDCHQCAAFPSRGRHSSRSPEHDGRWNIHADPN